jgi:L-ribulose-5-phosphate 3-epimerase
MTRFGIMQGRLVPPVADRFQCFPRESWADEFAFAAEAGLDCIEWIYDEFGADVNPIATDDGIDAILALSDRHGIRVVSMCADYFMDRPLVRATDGELNDRIDVLFGLVDRARRLGIERIVLPFVDVSRIDTNAEFDQVVETISRSAIRAEECGIELHLETSLGPDRFAELLDRLAPGTVRVNYDIGNSASLGYEPRAEFAAYGDRVGSVHIKDRVNGGGTVPLGTGDADLPTVFDCLQSVGYAGDFVLQAARDAPGDEVRWARQNLERVRAYLSGAKVSSA